MTKEKERTMEKEQLRQRYESLPDEVKKHLSFEAYAAMPEEVSKHITRFTAGDFEAIKELDDGTDDFGLDDFLFNDEVDFGYEDVNEIKEDNKMKICNTEAMKRIKELEAQKEMLVDNEDRYCQVSYKEGENKIAGDYDYDDTRKKIDALDDEMRAIRCALSKANCTVKVDGFGVTIGEALVMLAQKQNKKAQLESLTENKQLSRNVTYNGVVEYTECVYDVKRVKDDLKMLRGEISALQMAIDRANLTNYITV